MRNLIVVKLLLFRDKIFYNSFKIFILITINFLIKNEDELLGNLNNLNHLLLNKEVFNVCKKPEIGSLMIFEILKTTEEKNIQESALNSDFIDSKPSKDRQSILK